MKQWIKQPQRKGIYNELRSTIHWHQTIARAGTVHGERTERIHLVSRNRDKVCEILALITRAVLRRFCIFFYIQNDLLTALNIFQFLFFECFLCCLFSCFSIAIRWVDLYAPSEWNIRWTAAAAAAHYLCVYCICSLVPNFKLETKQSETQQQQQH